MAGGRHHRSRGPKRLFRIRHHARNQLGLCRVRVGRTEQSTGPRWLPGSRRKQWADDRTPLRRRGLGAARLGLSLPRLCGLTGLSLHCAVAWPDDYRKTGCGAFRRGTLQSEAMEGGTEYHCPGLHQPGDSVGGGGATAWFEAVGGRALLVQHDSGYAWFGYDAHEPARYRYSGSLRHYGLLGYGVAHRAPGDYGYDLCG